MTDRPDNWERVVRERAMALHRNIASLRRWADGAAPEDRAEADEVFEMLAASSLKALDEITFEDLPLARLLDRADLVVRIEGEAVGSGGPVRASLVSRTITNMQRALTRVMRELAAVPRKEWERFADLSFIGTAPGSLYIGFALPRPEDLGLLPGVVPAGLSSLAADALKLLSAGSKAVAEKTPVERLVLELPEPRVRDAVLLSVQQLAPTQKSGASLVALSGVAGGLASLSPGTRAASNQLLKETSTRATTHATYVGTVREIDFDARRFDLRNVDDIGEIRCAYDSETTDAVAETWVNARVEVRGMVELDRRGQPALLWASSVRRLSSAPPTPMNDEAD